MKWEELSMKDKTAIMAAAVRNGYTDIRSIKEAYANYLNQKQTTGNRYAEGGDTDEPEVINLLDNLPIWKALDKIDYEAIPDPEFTREKTGSGSIEYFSAEHPEGITYKNGYHRDHPMPGRDVILYNPNTNDKQDIRLDALHIMPKDPTYDALNSLYREAAREGDVAWAAQKRYKEDLEKYGADNIDPYEQYFNNEADGLLRNMFIEGTPEYIESKEYHPDKEELQQWNAHLMPYINRIEQYLKTGERPSDILPELVVTNQKSYGGNLFKGGGDVKGVRGFFNLLKKRGINVVETSGYRKGAVTKFGHASFHSMLDEWGNPKAQDFKPADGDWDKLRRDIYRDPELVQYMLDNNIGILEENTPEAQKKYGTKSKDGKGVWHIGGDTAAKRDRDNNISIFGTTYHPMQDVTWADVQARRKQFELTPEEERLYNSKPTLFYNADYVNWNDPTNQKTFEQAYAPYALNSELYNTPSNGWALYNNLLQSQNLSDPLSWMATMASLSPKTTPQQKEAANTMYQLFAPQGDDYMYHGLNFAAYGGNMNKFGDGGFYDLPEQRAYQRAINLKAPYTNYEDAVDLEDSVMLRLKKFFDKGISNCTLTGSQIINPNLPVARANTLVKAPRNYNLYQVDEGHIVPGTMVIASHPDMSDYNPDQKYHTMIVTGFAPNDFEYTFRDGTKYQIKKGEPLVSYSRGKASADNYVHDIPLSVYNANSEGKTYNRYYRPIDENYPQVMLPEITFTK